MHLCQEVRQFYSSDAIWGTNRVWSKPVGDVGDKEDKEDKEDKAQKKSFSFQPTTYDHTRTNLGLTQIPAGNWAVNNIFYFVG